MMILSAKVYPDGWLFSRNDRDYVENKNDEANIRGGGQLLIVNDGRSMFLGSGLDFSLALDSQTAQEAFAKLQEFWSARGK